MNQRNPQKIRKSSANALKMVYYVIVGLAITEGLHRTFIKDGSFIGMQCLTEKNLTPLILLFALLPTICRFVHGASIHLDLPPKKPYKTIWDFTGFFLQASFLYLMALSLEKPKAFSLLFMFMLAGDASWLLLLKKKQYIDLSPVEKQWLLSDIYIIIALFSLLLIRYQLECCWEIDKTAANVLSAIVILIIAWIATYKDYRSNKNFYFPNVTHD